MAGKKSLNPLVRHARAHLMLSAVRTIECRCADGPHIHMAEVLGRLLGMKLLAEGHQLSARQHLPLRTLYLKPQQGCEGLQRTGE